MQCTIGRWCRRFRETCPCVTAVSHRANCICNDRPKSSSRLSSVPQSHSISTHCPGRQTFQEVPALVSIVPTQSKPTFAAAQIIVLAIIVAIAIGGVIRFRPHDRQRVHGLVAPPAFGRIHWSCPTEQNASLRSNRCVIFSKSDQHEQ